MCEYMKIACIAKMEDKYKGAFRAMVDAYSPKLSPRIIDNDAVYTLHDFEHHCIHIYEIISYVLFDQDIVYDDSKGLDQRELLLLNYAVLFHDISMSVSLDNTREKHSIKSAEYIQSEYDRPDSSLRARSTLNNIEIKALKEIVKAHSDVKDTSIRPENNGLNAPGLMEEYNTKYGNKIIRTKFLAGVLRLADELDVSVDRLGTGGLESELEELENKIRRLKKDYEGNKDQIERLTRYTESYPHWKRLHLISTVKRNDEEDDLIKLVIDDDYVTKCLDEGQTEQAIAHELIDVYDKVEQSLQECIKLAFNTRTVKKYVPVKKIEIATKIEKLKKEFENLKGIRMLPQSADTEEKNIVNTDISSVQNNEPQVIDQALEEELCKEIGKRNLIKFGHFLLTDKYCARDWIDTQEIVETKKILNDMVKSVVKHIELKQYKGYTIVGIDLVGSLLASGIAFSLQAPLSYVVSEKNSEFSGKQEKEIPEELGKIILITDAIVTYDTVHRIIEKYSWNDNVGAIYTIFYRRSDTLDDNVPYIQKTFCISNRFKAELFEKEKCEYKKEQCIAMNRKMAIDFKRKGDGYENSGAKF